MSVKNKRCPACDRRRKKSHETKCGTDKAYSSGCITYKKFKEQKKKDKK